MALTVNTGCVVLQCQHYFVGVMFCTLPLQRLTKNLFVTVSFKVLSLPSFVWRQLVGEKVTWSRDFMTVDLAQVRVCSDL